MDHEFRGELAHRLLNLSKRGRPSGSIRVHLGSFRVQPLDQLRV